MSPEQHAQRQAALYAGIWGQDPKYGTRLEDVVDTVEHRIAPHMRRILAVRPVDVIDFGAGDGRFLAELHKRWLVDRGIGVDLHCPQAGPGWLTWLQQPLWQRLPVRAEYAISTDTLEHMPPEMVPQVLQNITASAPHGFLRISTKQDIYGTERGLHLHETVQPPEWWLARLADAGFPQLHSWRIYPGHAIEVWY